MDNYIEVVVPKKPNFKDRIISFGATVLPMLIGSYLVIMLYFAKVSALLPLAIIACAVLYYLAYKIYCRFNVEWEYILVGDELRFSKIINKSKRRDILTINLSKIETVAKANDTSFSHPLKNVTRKFFFISQTNNDYLFLIGFDKKGNKVAVFFEPDEKMLENFKTTLRGKLFV